MANVVQEAQPPRELPNVPADVGGSGQTRLIIQAIEPTLSEIKGEMRDVRRAASGDFKWLIGGFILIGGMMIAGYFRLDDRISKIEEKFQTLSIMTTKIETRLEDLLQRIPPIQAPAPRR